MQTISRSDVARLDALALFPSLFQACPPVGGDVEVDRLKIRSRAAHRLGPEQVDAV
jgi:hypothetical protein